MYNFHNGAHPPDRGYFFKSTGPESPFHPSYEAFLRSTTCQRWICQDNPWALRPVGCTLKLLSLSRSASLLQAAE